MNKDKKKLFEAFEKVCGIKLLNEQDTVLGEVDSIKKYMLKNFSLKIDIVSGTKEYNDKEFEFDLNNKQYYGVISLIVTAKYEEDPGTQYAPPSGDMIIENVEITYINIGDEDDDIILYDQDNQNHIDFIEQLEKEIELI
jgi:hypothetical protein